MHLTRWSRPDRRIEITLNSGPVVKPTLGSGKPAQTSISILFREFAIAAINYTVPTGSVELDGRRSGHDEDSRDSHCSKCHQTFRSATTNIGGWADASQCEFSMV
jgi:hypothetical protein